MWSAFRVRAPALQPSEELRWVLLRAFAPLDAAAPHRVDAARVVSLSRELDLAARIATRHSRALVEQLGPDAARELSFHRLQAVAIDRVLSTLGAEILHAADTLHCPVIWMKHAALRRAGLVAEGERATRDVDLLVPEALAGPLHVALIARGFGAARELPQFHLPPLRRAPGEVAEIHSRVWGIDLPGLRHDARGANAAHIVSDGFAERLTDGSYVPIKPLLAAHAIVHGLIQHRTSPEGYPIMRVISDLCSLGPLDRDGGRQCQRFAAHEVQAELTFAALRLSEALRRGADVFASRASSPEFELLSHVVAAAVDPAYRRALRFERVWELANVDALRRAFRGAFAAAAGEPAGRRPRGALQQLSLRAARPLSLALELAHGAASYGALQILQRKR
jgi:hypothetical protein